MSDVKYTTMVTTYNDETGETYVRHIWNTAYNPTSKDIAEYITRPPVCALLKPRNNIENRTD